MAGRQIGARNPLAKGRNVVHIMLQASSGYPLHRSPHCAGKLQPLIKQQHQLHADVMDRRCDESREMNCTEPESQRLSRRPYAELFGKAERKLLSARPHVVRVRVYTCTYGWDGKGRKFWRAAVGSCGWRRQRAFHQTDRQSK